MYGLTNTDLQVIIEVIKRHPEIDEAIIFGSRALDTYKKGSDVDIALKGKEIESIASAISGVLNDESPLPYFFDVLDYNLIDSAALKDHINRVGIKIYARDC